jgi:hypothetical protein
MYEPLTLLRKAGQGEFSESEIGAWVESGHAPLSELNALLREAAAHNMVPVVQLLVKAGANPYDTDAKGRTAFNRAASNGLDALAWLTEEAFTDLSKPHRRWPAYDLNTPFGEYNSTLVTYAVKACSKKAVENMIAAGADLSITNESGWTLLHCAAVMPGRTEVLNLLIDTFLKDEKLMTKIFALTTKKYETTYGDQKIIYPAGLTAAGLCLTRMAAEDGKFPPELGEYVGIFGGAARKLQIRYLELAFK